MKKMIFGLTLTLLMLSGSLVYAMSEAEAERLCKEYAQEDRIPAAEMAEYMDECIKDLIRTDTEDKNN